MCVCMCVYVNRCAHVMSACTQENNATIRWPSSKVREECEGGVCEGGVCERSVREGCEGGV